MTRGDSKAANEAQIRAAFAHVTVVHEDSDRRLWFEIGELPRVQHLDRRPTSGLLSGRVVKTVSPHAVDTRALTIRLTAIILSVILYVGWGSEDGLTGALIILLVAGAILRDLKRRYPNHTDQKP